MPANSVNTQRGSPLSEHVGFVLVQDRFAASRQTAAVIWEGDMLYAGGILRAVHVVGPETDLGQCFKEFRPNSIKAHCTHSVSFSSCHI